MTLTTHSDDGVYGTDVYWTELQVDIFRVVAVVGGLPSVAIFPLGFCWAPFGYASGVAGTADCCALFSWFVGSQAKA